jgi:hypothetical protein
LKNDLENAMATGADGEEKLKKEIKRLIEEIENLKIKSRKDF